ncbi:unnamed protein product [Effrenium voratum]|nr:unnamed protein product [Effrenium voratum]
MRYLLAFWGALAPTSADISLSTSLGPAWVQVYSRNFSVPYEPLLPRDIRRLQASEVEGADLWVMSPPCQPYTRMGLQRDLADRRAAPLKRLLELLPKLRRPPEGLLLENVVGFETSASFELLSEALCRAGLEVRQFMLSPLQLGIPNRRPRIYLLARRSDTPCVHPLESEFPGQQRSPEPQRLETFLQPRQEIDTETSVPAKLLELLWNRGQRWEVVTAGSTSSSTFTSGYTTTCFDAHRFGPLLAESGRAPPGGDDRRSDWCPPRPLPGGRMQRLVEPGEAVRRGSGMMLAPKALVPSYDTFLRVLQWKPKRNRSPPCRGSGCLLASCMFPLSSLSFSCLMSLSASGFFRFGLYWVTVSFFLACLHIVGLVPVTFRICPNPNPRTMRKL